MKSLISFLIFFFVSISIYLFLKEKLVNEKFIFYSLENKKYKLLIADEEREWVQGLMFIRKPVDFDGIIFIFPDKKIRTFWNKNTFVDLDVYWIDDDKVIGKTFLSSIEKTKEIKTISSPLPVDKVIEIIR